METEKGNKNNGKKITVMLEGEEFTFQVGREDFQRFQREALKSPSMAVNNLLVATVTSHKSKDLSVRFENDWVLPGVLMEPIGDELGVNRQASLKK